jgi:hypothetical protein
MGGRMGFRRRKFRLRSGDGNMTGKDALSIWSWGDIVMVYWYASYRSGVLEAKLGRGLISACTPSIHGDQKYNVKQGT